VRTRRRRRAGERRACDSRAGRVIGGRGVQKLASFFAAAAALATDALATATGRIGILPGSVGKPSYDAYLRGWPAR